MTVQVGSVFTCKPNKSPVRLQFHSCEHKTAIVFWTELDYLTTFSFKSSLTIFLILFFSRKRGLHRFKTKKNISNVKSDWPLVQELQVHLAHPSQQGLPLLCHPIATKTHITKYRAAFSTPPTQHDQRNQIIRRKHFQVHLWLVMGWGTILWVNTVFLKAKEEGFKMEIGFVRCFFPYSERTGIKVPKQWDCLQDS